MRSLVTRRTIHLVLGSIAVICLTIAIFPYKSENTAVTAESVTPHPVEATVVTVANVKEPAVDSTSNATNKGTEAKSGTQVGQASDSKSDSKESNAKKVADSLASKKEQKKEKEVADSKIYEKLVPDTNEEKTTKISDQQSSSASKATDAIWQTIKIQKNDTLAKVFTRHGFSNKDLQSIMVSEKAKTHLKALQSGQTLKLQVADKKQVEGLTLDINPESVLTVARNDAGKGYNVSVKQIPVEKKVAFGKGEIRASLTSAAKRAGLDNNIVNQLVDIYGGNIDFSSDLRPKDTFRVLFEQKCLSDGERIKTGPVLAAEIVNGGKKIQAIRYTDKTGRTSYFSPDGHGLNQAFLRSPVNFTSVSSGFGLRKHPVYHKMRAHKGVDYAAPRGTPVMATGDAKVVFVGNKAGYGKTIELQHGARYSTLYAHLSRFAKNLRSGAEVKQGDVIGYVGRTGLATGDHLHYEFRIDGIHRDPLTVALPKSKLIPDAHKKHFLAHAKEMIRLMDVHEQKVSVATVEFQINE